MSNAQTTGLTIRIPRQAYLAVTRLTIKVSPRPQIATTLSGAFTNELDDAAVLNASGTQVASSSRLTLDPLPTADHDSSSDSQSSAERDPRTPSQPNTTVELNADSIATTRRSSRLSLKEEPRLASSATPSAQCSKDATDSKAMPPPLVPGKALALQRASPRLRANNIAAPESGISRSRNVAGTVAVPHRRSSSQGSLKENNAGTEGAQAEKDKQVIKPLPKRSNATRTNKAKKSDNRTAPSTQSASSGILKLSPPQTTASSTSRISSLIRAVQIVESAELASKRAALGLTIDHLQAAKEEDKEASSRRDAGIALLALGQRIETGPSEYRYKRAAYIDPDDEADSEPDASNDISELDVLESDRILGYFRDFNAVATTSEERTTASTAL